MRWSRFAHDSPENTVRSWSVWVRRRSAVWRWESSALLVLILAIAQLPPLLVSVSDGFLKPLLLGRGVEVPMLVILIGAIGGALAMGVMGLFIGAVILSVGHRLWLWWAQGEPEGPEEAPPVKAG